MVIFGSMSMSMFKSGRTTCTSTHHPFAEGADPPTPVTASASRDTDHIEAHPFKAVTAIDPEIPVPHDQEPRSGKANRTPVRARQCPLTTPSKTTPVTPTRTPPRTWSKSVNSTPISALPPTLPPPNYGLPPTPEASPQQGPRSAIEGSTRPLHIRKPSVRTLSKPLPAGPSVPPTSFTSPASSSKHGRTTSGPSPIRAAPPQRFRSASESASTVFFLDSKYGMRDRYPAPSPQPGQDSFHSNTSTVTRIELPSPIIIEHVEKHRPTALKLRTSNLTDSPRGQGQGSGRNGHRRLPTIDINGSNNEVMMTSGQMLHPHISEGVVPAGRSPRSAEREQALGTGFSLLTPDKRPTVARLESDTTSKASTEKFERRRSMSTGDVLNISQLDKRRNPDDTPRKRRENPQRTEETSQTLPASPTPCSHTYTPKTASTALSSVSRTPASACTNLPDIESAMPTMSTGTAKPFDNLPLPWSTVEASTLQQDLGQQAVDSLMDFTLTQLVALPPRLLHPSILRTSASEEGRLRSELARLKEKYHALISHRDALAKRIEQSNVKADQAKVHKMVQALGQTSRKCDRVARQVYICNDQIRQIEIQAEEHVVGALRLALRKKEEELGKMEASVERSPSEQDGRSSAEQAENRGVKQGGEAFISLNSPSEPTETVATRLPTSGPVVRFLQPATQSIRSPTSPKFRENMRISFCESSGSTVPRPISTATIININTLSFPLPPDRIRHGTHPSSSSSADWSSASTTQDSETPTTDTETATESDTDDEGTAGVSYRGLEVQVEPEAARVDDESENPHDFDFESTDSHRTATISILGGNEIVIYPPGHSRSLSAPSCCIGVDLPYTPASWGHEQYPPTPSTSGGHLDISLVDKSSANQSRRHERSVSESDCISPLPSAARVTEPLRLKVPLPLPSRSSSLAWKEGSQPIRRQTRSMNVKSGQEGIKKSRVVRDSMLETPESILLSLATAPLWTKGVFEDE
ncbi:hypothetical protein IAT40_007651 [Kwoniella sp. CBS 6097]